MTNPELTLANEVFGWQVRLTISALDGERKVIFQRAQGGTSTYCGKGEVMVALPEQLITLGIWEYQRIKGTEKWWLLHPINLLWQKWGFVIWLLTSHYYFGATTGVNLSLQLCTQYCCMAGGVGWRMSHMSSKQSWIVSSIAINPSGFVYMYT